MNNSENNLVCSIVSNCVMKVLILDEYESSVSLMSVKEVEIKFKLIWGDLELIRYTSIYCTV